eukprot:jgi/Mesen1/4527/ME000230S03672
MHLELLMQWRHTLSPRDRANLVKRLVALIDGIHYTHPGWFMEPRMREEAFCERHVFPRYVAELPDVVKEIRKRRDYLVESSIATASGNDTAEATSVGKKVTDSSRLKDARAKLRAGGSLSNSREARRAAGRMDAHVRSSSG